MKPSELTEGQWIKLTGEHKHKNKRASIGFHVEYNQLSCFALHPGCDADMGWGLEITSDPQLADEIYAQYADNEHITIETGGGYNDTDDWTPKTVRRGVPATD
jgi:hypothetical protein